MSAISSPSLSPTLKGDGCEESKSLMLAILLQLIRLGQILLVFAMLLAIVMFVSFFLARARKKRRRGESHLDFFRRDLTRRRRKKKRRVVGEEGGERSRIKLVGEEIMLSEEGFGRPSRRVTKWTDPSQQETKVTGKSSKLTEYVFILMLGILVGRYFLPVSAPLQPIAVPKKAIVGSILHLDDVPVRNTSHKDPTGDSITKQQLLEPFVVPDVAGYSVATIHPGQTVTLHEHESMHEFFYVLSGTGVFMMGAVDDQQHQVAVQAGTFLHFAPHEPHGIHVPVDSDDGDMKVFVSGVVVEETASIEPPLPSTALQGDGCAKKVKDVIVLQFVRFGCLCLILTLFMTFTYWTFYFGDEENFNGNGLSYRCLLMCHTLWRFLLETVTSLIGSRSNNASQNGTTSRSRSRSRSRTSRSGSGILRTPATYDRHPLVRQDRHGDEQHVAWSTTMPAAHRERSSSTESNSCTKAQLGETGGLELRRYNDWSRRVASNDATSGSSDWEELLPLDNDEVRMRDIQYANQPIRILKPVPVPRDRRQQLV